MQPLFVDQLFTLHADSVGAREDSAQSGIDVTDLLDFARDLGKVYIDQEVGEGFLIHIVHLAGQLCVAFSLPACKRRVNLPP